MHKMLSVAVMLLLQLLAQRTVVLALPVEDFAEQLAEQRLFAGMLHVDQGERSSCIELDLLIDKACSAQTLLSLLSHQLQQWCPTSSGTLQVGTL
jgi:hypothetical protein